MEIQLQTVRIAYVSPSSAMRAIMRAGQMEAGKVWMSCRDALHEAMKSRSKWPGRDALQKRVKGKFTLHSQSAQMVAAGRMQIRSHLCRWTEGWNQPPGLPGSSNGLAISILCHQKPIRFSGWEDH
jgi:hypothetical protein